MPVEVRMGLVRDRMIEGPIDYIVRRGRDGWRYVGEGRGSRVRYDGWRDVLHVEAPAGSLRIRFRWRNTTFTWQGRTYRIQPSAWSRVTIFDGEHPVRRGRLTFSGIRLDFVDPKFRDIERELAFGLAQRAATIAMVIAVAH